MFNRVTKEDSFLDLLQLHAQNQQDTTAVNWAQIALEEYQADLINQPFVL